MALYRFGPVCNLIWLTQNLLDSNPSEFESRILYHIFTIMASYLFHVRLTRYSHARSNMRMVKFWTLHCLQLLFYEDSKDYVLGG